GLGTGVGVDEGEGEGEDERDGDGDGGGGAGVRSGVEEVDGDAEGSGRVGEAEPGGAVTSDTGTSSPPMFVAEGDGDGASRRCASRGADSTISCGVLPGWPPASGSRSGLLPQN